MLQQNRISLARDRSGGWTHPSCCWIDVDDQLSIQDGVAGVIIRTLMRRKRQIPIMIEILLPINLSQRHIESVIVLKHHEAEQNEVKYKRGEMRGRRALTRKISCPVGVPTIITNTLTPSDFSQTQKLSRKPRQYRNKGKLDFFRLRLSLRLPCFPRGRKRATREKDA